MFPLADPSRSGDLAPAHSPLAVTSSEPKEPDNSDEPTRQVITAQ